jgi:predicted DNA-binding transcriptional regulator AlpA
MEETSEAAREWIALGDCARRLGISRAAVYGRIKRGTLDAKHGNRGGYIVAWPPPDHDGQGDITLQSRDQSRDDNVTITVLQVEMAELRIALARAEGEIKATSTAKRKSLLHLDV